MIERARERRKGSGRPTILFLDEIHRFNKAQQDALLPAVEEGLLTLIGATTENPYFEVNSALLSRCAGLRAAAARRRSRWRRCCGGRWPTPSAGSPSRRRSRTRRWRCWPSAAAATPGSRSPALERAVERAQGKPIDVAAIEDALQRKALDYDRQGDRHYDFVSAWIKATRGSDVDASLYYLAVMLEGGEDPRFIARRMVILASEDIGNADPQALLVADAAARAVDRVGLPECALNLAQACRLPRPRSQVQRLLQGARGGPGRGPRARRQDAARLPARRPLPRRQPSSAAAAATATPTTSRAGSATSSCSPTASPAAVSTRPTDRGFEAELGRRLGRAADEIRPVQVTWRNFLKRAGFQWAAFQARARESRHTGRRPGLGASGRDLHRGRGGRVGLDSAPSAASGAGYPVA